MKKIRVREATTRDLGLFRKLQSEFFDDPDNDGLLVEYDRNSTEFFDNLFNSLVESDNGFVLMVADKAMIAVGPMSGEAKFKLGALANVWTAYVTSDARNMGIEDILIDTAKQVTRDMGYGGITFASPSVGKWIDAVEGSGFEPFMIHYVLDLGVDDESD